jgi:hypothetical protein
MSQINRILTLGAYNSNLEMLGKLNRYLIRFGIFLITAALIAGMAGCGFVGGGGGDSYDPYLIIASTIGGSVIEPGEGDFGYAANTKVGLVAEADEHCHFVNWAGDVSNIADVYAPATNITMNDHYFITANFELDEGYYYLTIASTYGGSVTEPGEGYFAYAANTTIDLVAEPDEHHQFVNWAGDVSNIADVYAAATNITMPAQDVTVTANFVRVYDLTMAVNPAGGGMATDETGTSPYRAGTDVSIKAVANPSYQFVKWTSPAGTFADENAATTTFTMPFQDITVTANFRIEIWDWYDLNATRNTLDCILMSDLDSTTAGYEELASPTANDGKGWQPIASFRGNLDGQGYEISDLFINRPDENCIGLFGEVSVGGTVQNISMTSITITGYNYVGGLVGRNKGTVSNSYSTGNVNGANYVGGLVGSNWWNWRNWGIVSNSYSEGSVIGNSSVGGLVGDNGGTVRNSYFTGSVTGGDYAGGLVGVNDRGTVTDSYSTGNVTGNNNVGGLVGRNDGNVYYSQSTGNVTGNNNVGGLVGYNGGVSTVSSSYSTSSVAGNNRVGGLVGDNGGFSTVYKSYSSGSVYGNDYIGGLVGRNAGGTVRNSYFTGSVTGDKFVGGLVGLNYGNVRNSHSTGNVTGVNYVGGVVGRTEWGGTVSNSYSTGSVNGYIHVGGLVGQNVDSTVSDSYSTGNVTGNDFVGGLVGLFSSGTVNNCYATGSVTGDLAVGGLVGSNWNSGTVSNSYSTGSVTGNGDVGGLVGNNGGAVSNSFWDTETSGQATSHGGTGKDTTEMQDINTFSGAGWNIITVALNETNPAYIWNIVNNVTYPFLSWQP